MIASLPLPVVLEAGKTRTVARVQGWAGLVRAGRTQQQALEALMAAVPRYRAALQPEQDGPPLPATTADLAIAGVVPGDATTDPGAPGAITDWDRQPLAPGEEALPVAILRASHRGFLSQWAAAGAAPCGLAPAAAGTGMPWPGTCWSRPPPAWGGWTGSRRPGPGGHPGQRRAAAAWHACGHAWELEDRLAA